MPISKIHISNFRSFDDVEIEPGNFNVLVGANASGKSNLLQALKFIQDIKNFGLENAVSLQGGIKYISNINLQRGLSTSITIEFKPVWKDIFVPDYKGYQIGLNYDQITYSIFLSIDNSNNLKLSSEEMNYRSHPFIISSDNGNKLTPEIHYNEVSINHKIKKMGENLTFHNFIKDFSFSLPSGEFFISKLENFIPYALRAIPINNSNGFNKNQTIIEKFPNLLPTEIMDFKIYDFDINLFRKFSSVVGESDLKNNGENLSIVLNSILAEPENKRFFYNMLTNILPYIKNLEVEKFYEKSLLLKIEEIYKENSYIPSFLMSDGTISAIFIVLALYFEKNNFSIFEEPEKSFHPSLISKLVQHFQEASEEKQIIITTHSPEVLKHSNINDLYLISRNKDGFSEISKPANEEMVNVFLANDLGIDELFVQNLLDV